MNLRTRILDIASQPEYSEKQRFAAHVVGSTLIRLSEGYQKILAKPPGFFGKVAVMDLFDGLQDTILKETVSQLESGCITEELV